MFFPLYSNVSTNILKIYKLPKIDNMMPKYCQTLVLAIIIYQANSMSQLRLASELYPFFENVSLGPKDPLALNQKKF